MLRKMMVLTMATMLVMSTTAFADETVVEDAAVVESTVVEEEVLVDEPVAEEDVTSDEDATTEDGATTDDDAIPEDEPANPLDDIIAQLDPESIDDETSFEDIIEMALENGLTDEDGNLLTEDALKDMLPDDDEIFIDGEEAVLNKALERVAMAKDLGITPGKLNLIQKLSVTYDEADAFEVDEWLDKPVKDIMKTIKGNRKEKLGDIEDTVETEAETELAEEQLEADAELAEEQLEAAEEEQEEKVEAEKESKKPAKEKKTSSKKTSKKSKGGSKSKSKK